MKRKAQGGCPFSFCCTKEGEREKEEALKATVAEENSTKLNPLTCDGSCFGHWHACTLAKFLLCTCLNTAKYMQVTAEDCDDAHK